MRKLAEIYLAVASTFYIVLGLSTLLPMLNLLGVMFGLLGMVIGAVPLRVINLIPGPRCGYPFINCSLSSQAHPDSFGLAISLLGVAAIILSIIGLISLNRITHNPKWIYLWYVISGLSLAVLTINILSTSNLELLSFVTIHPLLVCLSTWILFKT